MPIITLNDQQVEVPAGINLIEAARLAGEEIPHYCYHPGLSIAGNCRMCLVEVEGLRGLQIGCNTFVKDGMVVRTQTSAVEDARRGTMEFLLLNHPIDCPICDQAGECGLQDYYMEYGRYDHRSKEQKVHKDKAVQVGPRVMLDQERCILCARCVRFCDEITETGELRITNRGEESCITTFPGLELDNPYSMNVVDLCPVGALTSDDFRFQQRVWFLKTASSVCTGCSKGCNIYIEQNNEHVYRYRPRPNAEVNQWWMCDAGRLSYKSINENRLKAAKANGQAVSRSEALAGIRSRLEIALRDHGAGSIAAVASPHASFEENAALKRFMASLGSDKLYAFSVTPDGDSDDFLIEADKSPNRASFAALGLDKGREALEAELKSGGIKALIVLRQDLVGLGGAELAKLVCGVDNLIVLSTHDDHTVEAAHVALPASTHAESYGSFVNSANRVQKFMAVMSATGDMETGWEWLAAIALQLKLTGGYQDIEEIWRDLRQTFSGLHEMSFYKFPDSGLPLYAAAPETVVAQ